MDCEEEDSSTSTTEIPFFIKITSKFNSFKDSSHITYDVEQQTSPELHEIKNELSGRLISRLFPFRLNQVRLGFEAFSGSSFGGMFGLVPVVTEKFNLEINDNKICLQAKCSFKDKATHLPFNKINLFEKIDLALSEAKLFPNFFEKLSTQLN